MSLGNIQIITKTYSLFNKYKKDYMKLAKYIERLMSK